MKNILLYFALKMFWFVALITIGITIFFLESVLKNRVHIIYGCALYTGKYGTLNKVSIAISSCNEDEKFPIFVPDLLLRTR